MGKIDTTPAQVNKIIESFSRTTEEIVSLDELKKLLSSGKKLIMKYGVDVTAPDLHIGHAVNLWMYRQLQDMGHKIVFLIGDFTTQIGDPTGKNKTRPIIPIKEIKKNADFFIKQAKMVLKNNSSVMEIRRNSEWYGKMSAKDLLSLMSMVTHDRLLNREMFRKRVEAKQEIYEHELIYPLLQGYDSVALKADLTIIGSDQLYNEMMGRFFQEKFGQKPQVIITTKITPGIDGKEKQSKSIGNFIGLLHTPQEKFGRIMSMPDNLIVSYLKVYTDIPLSDINAIEQDVNANPMKYKLLLAEKIVERYHGDKIAAKAKASWINTFSKKEIPDDIRELSIENRELRTLEVLIAAGVPSKSEARRLLDQGAIKVNGEVVKDQNEPRKDGDIVKIGKKEFVKIKAK